MVALLSLACDGAAAAGVASLEAGSVRDPAKPSGAWGNVATSGSAVAGNSSVTGNGITGSATAAGSAAPTGGAISGNATRSTSITGESIANQGNHTIRDASMGNFITGSTATSNTATGNAPGTARNDPLAGFPPVTVADTVLPQANDRKYAASSWPAATAPPPASAGAPDPTPAPMGDIAAFGLQAPRVKGRSAGPEPGRTVEVPIFSAGLEPGKTTSGLRGFSTGTETQTVAACGPPNFSVASSEVDPMAGLCNFPPESETGTTAAGRQNAPACAGLQAATTTMKLPPAGGLDVTAGWGWGGPMRGGGGYQGPLGPTAGAVNAGTGVTGASGNTASSGIAASRGGPANAGYAPVLPANGGSAGAGCARSLPSCLSWGAIGLFAGDGGEFPLVRAAAATATATDESAMDTFGGWCGEGLGLRRGSLPATAALGRSQEEAPALPPNVPRRPWAPEDIRSSVSKLQLSRLKCSSQFEPPPPPPPPPPPSQREVASQVEISQQLEIPPQYSSNAADFRAPWGPTPELRRGLNPPEMRRDLNAPEMRGDLKHPEVRGDLNHPEMRGDISQPAKPWASPRAPPSGPGFWSAVLPVSAEKVQENESLRESTGFRKGVGGVGVGLVVDDDPHHKTSFPLAPASTPPLGGDGVGGRVVVGGDSHRKSTPSLASGSTPPLLDGLDDVIAAAKGAGVPSQYSLMSATTDGLVDGEAVDGQAAEGGGGRGFDWGRPVGLWPGTAGTSGGYDAEASATTAEALGAGAVEFPLGGRGVSAGEKGDIDARERGEVSAKGGGKVNARGGGDGHLMATEKGAGEEAVGVVGSGCPRGVHEVSDTDEGSLSLTAAVGMGGAVGAGGAVEWRVAREEGECLELSEGEAFFVLEDMFGGLLPPEALEKVFVESSQNLEDVSGRALRGGGRGRCDGGWGDGGGRRWVRGGVGGGRGGGVGEQRAGGGEGGETGILICGW